MTNFQPDQTYDVRVKSATHEVPNGKSAYINVTFEKEDGATIQHRMYLTPAAVEYTRRDLITLGAGDPDDPDFMLNIGKAMSGLECNIKTYADTWNNKNYTKVKFINPVQVKMQQPEAPQTAASDSGLPF